MKTAAEIVRSKLEELAFAGYETNVSFYVHGTPMEDGTSWVNVDCDIRPLTKVVAMVERNEVYFG